MIELNNGYALDQVVSMEMTWTEPLMFSGLGEQFSILVRLFRIRSV